MISVCYLIVCINLYYYFDQAETSSTNKSWYLWEKKEDCLLKTITADNQDEILAKSETPFWNVSYDEELIQKQHHCSEILEMIVNSIDSLKISMTCKVLPIVPSPVTKAYRNRDVFGVSRGVDGNVKTVGFVVQNISLSLKFAIHPEKITTIKESHKQVAQVYENFIRISSLPPNFESIGVGHWRHLLVRSNQEGQIMASVTVNPLRYTFETISNARKDMKMYFHGRLPNITLYHQQCSLEPISKCTRSQAPYYLLYGQSYFLDTLNGYKFKILPDSYFHLNSLGAEVFFDTVIKTAELTPNTTVLDVYSFAGVFSIMVSKFVRESYAIEPYSQSKRNAIYNARLNKVSNVNFVLGSPIKILYGLIQKLQESSDLLVLVYPGRRGAGFDVMQKIQESTGITKVMYIARKPDSPRAIRDVITLCSCKTSKYPPFTLIKAIPVDTLPRTAHVELIYMFQRKY